MLYQIANELGAALKKQGVPFPVVFGPESTEDMYAGLDRIVVEHAPDTFEVTRATHPNPRSTYRRQQGVVVRIFARSSLANASWHDHAELAEHVIDHIVAELDVIVRARRNEFKPGRGRFIEPRDAAGSPVPAGAVYELEIEIDRGIERRTWAGEKRPEVVVGPGGVKIKSSTKVSDELGPAGTPPPDAETAC